MDAGALDQQIVLQRRSVIFDELGAEVETWNPHSQLWAKVLETPGREFLKGEYHAEERAVFVVRWRELDSTYRVQWRARTWNITSVTGTRREGWTWLHCLATEGAN
jgi:head-tail adaptor